MKKDGAAYASCTVFFFYLIGKTACGVLLN